MLRKSFALIAWAAIVCSGNALGQSFGTDFGAGCSGGSGGGSTNCGREISQSEAAALWDGYCYETCHDFKQNRSCGLGGRCAAGDCFGHGNAGVAAAGCNSCSAPAIGGRAIGGPALGGPALGGHGGRLAGRLHNASSGCDAAGLGGASCFGYPGGGFGNCGGACGSSGFGGAALGRNAGHGCGNGCGLFGGGRSGAGGCGHHEGRIFRFLTGGNRPGLFSQSAANCGANGGYFNEQVGPEYGTSGLLSNVAGGSTHLAPGCGADATMMPSAPAHNIPLPAARNEGDPGWMLAPQQ